MGRDFTNDDIFVWADIETTGLNPREESMLEIGLVLTTPKLLAFAGTSLLVGTSVGDYPALRASCSDYVQQMHDKSGLWAELEKEQPPTVTEVEDTLVAWLDDQSARWNIDFGKQPLCGSSVGFDRGFLREHMPRVEGKFHYRNIDISTVKELARRLNPEVYENTPEKAERHRALPDIQDTVAEAGWYFDHFIKYDEEMFA